MKILKYCKIIITVSLCLIFTCAHANEIDNIIWDNLPIKIQVSVGEERIISFSENISVDSRAVKYVNLVVANKNIYITPKFDFESQRIFVKSNTSGNVYILDLRVVDSADKNIINIKRSSDLLEAQDNESITSVDLVRFAVQSLYSPERLIEHNPGIYRVPMNIKRSLNLYPDNGIDITPIAQWKGGDKYVIAFKASNNTKLYKVLDPRKIRGAWRVCAIFPFRELMPIGAKKDNSVIFMVSDRGVHESI